MGLFNMFRKKDAVMLPKETAKNYIVKTFMLKDEADTMDAVQHINLGSTIAFIKIKNHLIMRESLLSLKKATTSVSGDIVGLPDNWFIIAPKGIELVKKNADAGKQVAEAVMSRAEKDSELKKAHDEFAGKITVIDEIDTY